MKIQDVVQGRRGVLVHLTAKLLQELFRDSANETLSSRKQIRLSFASSMMYKDTWDSRPAFLRLP